jgi:Tfp pilus assembly protein PilN
MSFFDLINCRYGLSIASIEVNVVSKGKFLFHCVLFSVKSNKIIINNEGTNFDDFNTLLNFTKGYSNIVLIITGKGIIQKKVILDAKDKLLFINQLLPNANEDQFYLQYLISKKNAFGSLARKDLIDEILFLFKKCNNIFILNISLGVSVVSILNPFLNTIERKISLMNYDFTFENNDLKDICTSDKSDNILVWDLKTDKIKNESIIAYSSGLAYLEKKIEQSFIKSEYLEESLKNYNQKKIFCKLRIYLLVLFFLVLIINFFVSDQYTKKLDLLESKLYENRNQINQLEKLKSDLIQKKNLSGDVIFGTHQKLSFLADQLALQIPNEITLIGMNIFPIQKRVKKEEKILFEENFIDISGQTNNTDVLNNWIKLLNEMPWVKSVSIVNYEKGQNETTAIFELKINSK